MISRARSGFLRLALPVLLGMLCFSARAGTGATNSTNSTATNSASVPVFAAEDSLRSYLQLQDQIHTLQLASEKSRLEAEAAAARNADLLNQRLDSIEKSISAQHSDELRQMQGTVHDAEQLQQSSKLVLLAAGAFATFGILVLLFAGFLQWTVVNRVAEVAARFPADGAVGLGTSPQLGIGDPKFLANPAAEQSSAQLLGVIAKLEKRVHQIEAAAQPPAALPEATVVNGGPHALTNGESHDGANGVTAHSGGLPVPAPEPPAAEDKHGTVTLLLGKGQTLLRLDKPEAAIMCFDEVLAVDPKNTDALVKKGAALERLEKLDEAIECFDLAIAADSAMTVAYLHKGGVFNRLERYAEALECYEKALKSQEKHRAASVVTE